ncbi:MAG TPA: hypothetical protein VND65_10900, partial [Candidatus Binatia bacterium]|nr:hypothetical protein [Candidatus Binatia bacterium]
MFPPRINRRFFRTFAQFLLLANASAQVTTSNEIGGRDRDAEHVQQRAEWFLHGRTIPGKSSAELRRRAYAAKMQARGARAHSFAPTASTGGWQPLGPVPLASDGSGDGFQNYNQVSGRATSVAIDPADPTGNTIYIGGAQAGVWKSTNAANANATNVTWIPLTDDQATLSIGAIAIQPGNTNAANSVIIAGTGEADNSADSYFGLGILRSADGGNTWNLTSTANTGSLSFSGLGATRITFSTANSNTVVAAMAATSEGVVDGALTSNTYRGLYTSTDGGQTWTYDALFSGGASEATSATSVVYNTAAGLFFAAIRYHGFYSSPDGLNWTVLANQPGAPGLLNATACPQNYVTTCPIYRAEITVVPGRNEMYVWFISLDSGGNPVDQGIWLSTNSGASWTQISDTGITNCGDSDGCGVQQGFYNLELLAVPNCPNGANTCTGDPTDLYAGAVNLYKCSLTSINPTCANTPFLNLTHVYGCNPLSALAHVHPDQHAAAFTILPSSSDLMYFANDGGIYRTLDGFTGLTTGSCTGTNLFDDLNQNLGSMTQFVSFSQSETDANTLLGGTQDNGSPATASATTNTSWGNVLSGDGGYNAIDPATGNWFASNPDTGSGTLGIQECSSGVNCNDSLFNVVVNSGDVGGDDGAFYFPYILDPQSATALVVGTCRVWTGPRTGGAFTDLSLNFDTLGVGTCTGDEVNVVRSVAAGGPSNSNGSQVIYATTDGLGPSASAPPVGGNVWVTTNPTAVSGVSSTFVNVTMNGPGGASINPNQFPISSAAIDTSDPTGNTAYVAIMGFTGGPGHIWQTVNAGANWSDFSGTGSNAIPDSPANAIAIDSNAHMIYVGTDVGVFQSSTSSPAWTEVGPIPSASATGFLPDVAITALALFDSGGQKLLRASTYGRGIWQFNLLATPNFAIAISNTPLTAFIGTNANFNGTLTAQDGYNNSVELSCTPGSSSPPSPCSPSPVSLVPTSTGAAFVVGVGTSTIADYDFNVQGAGSDSNNTTNLTAVTLHVVNLNLTPPSPGTVTAPDGTTSPPVSFQVVAEGTFTQSVTLSCSIAPPIPGATCNFTPGITVDPTPGSPVNATATVSLPSGTALKNYTVTLQATTEGAPQPFTTPFTLTVVANPDFLLSESTAFPNVKFGSNGTTGPIQIASQDGFNSQVTLSCAPTFGLDSCGLNPSLVTTFPATSTLTIYGSSFVVPGAYTLSVEGVSGSLSHYLNVPFNVGDFTFTGPSTLSASPGSQAVANLTLSSIFSYSGQINLTCNASSLPGAQCTIGGQNPIALAAGATAPVTVTINVPNGATANTYNITINAQDVGGEPTNSLSIPLSVTQVVSDNFQLATSQPFPTGDAGSQQTATVSVTSNYTGSVTASCNSGSLGGQCSVTSPHSVTPFPISPGAALTLTLTLNIPNSAAPNPSNSYSVVLTVTDSSGQPAQTLSLPLTVIQDFAVGTPSPSTQTIAVGQSITYNFSVLPIGAQFGDNVSFA